MVEVTQADRKAAASVAVLVEMRELILAGRADHHAEPWAAHRIAALEEAAKVADRSAKLTEASFTKAVEFRHAEHQTHFAARNREAEELADAIRALKENHPCD